MDEKHGTPGRPVTKEIVDQCREITSYLAAGSRPKEIRQKMGLSKRQWHWRMRHIRRNSQDATDIWAIHSAKTDARYRQLEFIRQKALTQPKPALDVARRAISDMIRLDKDLIEVGQELGVYKKMPKKIELEVTNPSLDMIYEYVDADVIEDAELEKPLALEESNKVLH